MNDKKMWIIISAVSGFTAVAIGAFGAHGLREKLSAEMLEVYKTGVFISIYSHNNSFNPFFNIILSKAKFASIFFLSWNNSFSHFHFTFTRLLGFSFLQ